MRDWNGACQQCYKKTSIHIMSMYSELLICMECKDKERKRPDYQQALEKDIADYKSRNNHKVLVLQTSTGGRKMALKNVKKAPAKKVKASTVYSAYVHRNVVVELEHADALYGELLDDSGDSLVIRPSLEADNDHDMDEVTVPLSRVVYVGLAAPPREDEDDTDA